MRMRPFHTLPHLALTQYIERHFLKVQFMLCNRAFIHRSLSARSSIFTAAMSSRGAFILFEGIDRSGKTTQCSKLIEHLKSMQARFT